MTIRKAINSDLNQLIRLRKEFYQFTQATLSPYLSRIREYKSDKDFEKDARVSTEKYLSDPQRLVFVAEDKNILVGYISGNINNKEHKLLHKEGYIDHWFVEQQFQDQGVGMKLYNLLVNEFKNANCTHITLKTHLEYKRTLEIYDHLGFIKKQVVLFKPL